MGAAQEGSKRLDWIWGLLCLIQLIQPWFGSVFPSQDGAIHLYAASMMVEASPLQLTWVELNPRLEPNVLIHYLAAGLLGIGLGADLV